MYLHHPLFTPNPSLTLLNPSFPPFFFSFPNSKTLIFQNLPPKPLRCSSSSSSETLPQSAIKRIADKLRSLGYVQDNEKEEKRLIGEGEEEEEEGDTSPGEIFVPLPTQLPKYRVGHSFDQSWSKPENPVPQPSSGKAIRRYNELRQEVWKEKVKGRPEERERERENVPPSLAELKLPQEELKRLRGIGIKLNQKLKIGKPGITEGIVNGIHERWRRSELVKLKCEDMSRLNMKRTHDLLERKTGGLVIWRSGSIIILYRGVDYKYPYFVGNTNKINNTSGGASPDQQMDGERSDRRYLPNRTAQPPLIKGVGSPNRVRFQLPGESQLVEEADHLLEGLGPRFTDWWGYEPLPVDADLLPATVPGHRRPFRLLPYGVKPQLTNDEMTTLRRLGRPLPCHFVLGENRKLQGLAASIIKLWEKCEIAKIAVKRGAQNTNSELMAEELKWLTGGSVISRDREYIVLYRGKDFLPAAVSSAIEQRRNYGIPHGLEENRTSSSLVPNAREHKLAEMELASEAEHEEANIQKRKLAAEERKLRSSEAAITRTSAKLSMALVKKDRAEKLLAELEKEEIQQAPEISKEGITEEERYMLTKIGLRMKPFLLLGRRGVFDGTVENMHLHWKYRELVKIITGERCFEEVQARARILETESGGILVAVERISKGHAIIVYRGKNYERPSSLRPQTLLNKKEALKRFVEAQRRESLKLHVLKLTKNVDELKLKLVKEEEELDEKQLTEEHKISDTDLETCSARDGYEANSTSFSATDGSRNSLQTTQQDLPIDFPMNFEEEKDKLDLIQSKPFSESVLEETMNGESSSTPCVDEFKSSVDTPKSEAELLAHRTVENGSDTIPFRAAPLSNKERLLLRKQALKMKYRPVLAVGRSNIVSGVARTIKDHFRKYPLAIVNVKGRAKGTSVQELVNKLEKATGAVLVSQEPTKVILYRGWGASQEPPKSSRDSLMGQEGGTRPVVSPELISAIRLECGLQRHQDSKTVA
ncbi:hypothetical protein LguiA_018560 [Lonicera macranthoides]